MMIAVIERQHQVVWGIGETTNGAMIDAQRWITMKRQQVGKLEFAQLDSKADLDCDGEVLWQWVKQSDTPIQTQMVLE
jgi:flagellar basal body rod protein FlgG